MPLEAILKEAGKGFSAGAVKIADPAGYFYSIADRLNTGVGYSSSRSIPTVHNLASEVIYSDPDQEVDFVEQALPRAGGTLLGMGATAALFYGIYNVGGPVALATIPAVAGLWSTGAAFYNYIYDSIHGEKIGDYHEKASFYDGFKYGWHLSTHLYMPLIHEFESEVTGRGLYNSYVESSIKGAATGMRRNFRALAGSFIGSLVGGFVDIASLGIVPMYKSIRDTIKTVKGERAESCRPAYEDVNQDFPIFNPGLAMA